MTIKGRKKSTPQKKPSRSLLSKIAAFNRENEACNKRLNRLREQVRKQAIKEGFTVK